MKQRNQDSKTQSVVKAGQPGVELAAPGLRYYPDSKPGISRRKFGKSFSYYQADTKKLVSQKTAHRIDALVIPPAWAKVWISPHANSHLQATGIDARGRKQYLYHQDWIQWRNEQKYLRLFDFAKCLPAIREQVRNDMRKRGLPRERVLATVVRLLETTCIRVGNESYVRQNESYGLTTLRAFHVDVGKCDIRFRFKGKSGKEHEVQLTDCMLADIVKKCKGKPNELLFQYTDAEDKSHKVTSTDVNNYLKAASGRDISAKDFRTWWATVLAALLLKEKDPPATASACNRQIQAVVKEVAKHLGNTPAVCRSSYIYPQILTAYQQGRCVGRVVRRKTEGGGLFPEEKAFVRFLKAEHQENS